jgi:chromatin remodeling complex protein RSC6
MPVKVVKSKKSVEKKDIEQVTETKEVVPVEVSTVEVKPVEIEQVEESPAEVSTVVEESSTEVLFKKLNLQFHDLVSAMKTIQANLKVLEKEVAKDRKELKKKNKKKTDKKKASGFAVPTPISNELANLLGLPNDSQIARTDVTSRVIAYVKEHNLQNPENKKQILPNEALSSILQVPEGDVITFFNIQTYLKKHFITLPVVEKSSEQLAVV